MQVSGYRAKDLGFRVINYDYYNHVRPILAPL